MSFLEDSFIMFFSQAIFFSGGWVFFIKMLFKDYEIHHVLVQLIFAITFALSCTMFELIIFEILGFLDSRQVLFCWNLGLLVSRYFHWHLDLYLMLFMVVGVIPFYIAYFVICNIGRGFGAVNYPYQSMAMFMRQVTPADVQSLERELLKRMDIIVAKKRKLALLRRGGAQQSSAGTGRLWGVLTGAASSVWSGGQSQSQLKQEIAAMECTVNIVFDRVGKIDPVTKTMHIVVNWLGFNIDVTFWSQQISFYVVGCIVVTSIRGLLLTLTKFFYAVSSSKSSNVIVLVFSQIMGMYFMSSVVLMRMNMPLDYRRIITDVLGDLQFSFYHRWCDVIFLVSALTSIMFIFLAHKQSAERDAGERSL
ncbi:Golgi pH regulator [Amphibalanus amphitrite]|uniref:Golgi pH regulator n=1 Tax=Amphibalanus amphitrite TaxID=1232801 RepID=A0A6A4WCQ6_AMPAM|nr:Golgi pH regulator [Amphibalanus amphitrite]